MSKLSDLILKDEYNFLHTNPSLGNNIILLTIGGSRGYGTNIESEEYISDYDLRGVALNSKREILIGNDFEQVKDSNTDTLIYSFNKFVNLASKCNPNTIELLGSRPEDYIFLNSVGKELINNSHMFLSKIAIKSFAGYAIDQLRRIENFLSAHRYLQYKKEEHIFNSIKNMLYSTFNNYAPINFENSDSYIDNMLFTKNVNDTAHKLNNGFSELFKKLDTNNSMKLYVDKSQKEDMELEIFADIDFKHFPLRDFFNIFQDMSCIINSFNKLGKRNTKKEDFQINKHAMHLVRLYYMAFDILEREQIITYRKNEHDLLMSIRNGDFMKEDGTFDDSFFDIVNDLDKKLKYCAIHTNLPDVPDYNKINDFRAHINEEIVNNINLKDKYFSR